MDFDNKILDSMKFIPELDKEFIPAILWIKKYKELLSLDSELLGICLLRNDGTVFRYEVKILDENYFDLTSKYIERTVKFILWQKGGYKIILSNKKLALYISEIYSKNGLRSFDSDFIGKKIFDFPIKVEYVPYSDLPEENDITTPLGRNLDGYRIGFDLGGSDRKCASLIDGKVIFSEEIKWNPYFESNPKYHIEGIKDSINRAAKKLPRVDAIGGSAAGVYVSNEVRGGSLYRGIPENKFETDIRKLFKNLQKEWNVPLDIVNDGEVAALAGSMELKDNAVLGISMGTSLASGFVTPKGNITPWLNELAFVPVDFRNNAPEDEWSKDIGCGVQYFSQQAVARLAKVAGIEFSDDIPFPQRLVEVQRLVKLGDKRAESIFNTIGIYFGYSVAYFREFYEFRNLLIMGRVTSGVGGEIIITKAKEVLKSEFPELKNINLCTPDEKNKRHGQAIAAASLPRRK